VLRRDAETGKATRLLYPMMLKDLCLRWAFIQKVYDILSIQMLLTVVVVYVCPVMLFFISTRTVGDLFSNAMN
jgi:protein lifeguard